jgi:hypothetical protein
MTFLNKIIAGLNQRDGGRNVRQRTKETKIFQWVEPAR